MRFDDSLRTVLAIDPGTPLGAASVWRQLVDLIGRGRVPADGATMDRLRAIHASVPAPVRAASARALAGATPPAALAILFAGEELAVAAPVLRAASLSADEWVALLPALTPEKRAVLRHRRDLPAAVIRSLEDYRPVDFVIEGAPAAVAPPVPVPPPAAPVATGDFVPVGAVARGLPVFAEAPRPAEDVPAPDAAASGNGNGNGNGNGFPISDLVARIHAFQRDRDKPGARARVAAEPAPTATAEHFRFETDAAGDVRWVDIGERAPLVGLSIARAADDGDAAGVDGAVAGAFRRRSAFGGGRLRIGGSSPMAGAWRVAGEAVFDPATGRFQGYRGTARRPRADESATPPSVAGDGLRQLVHELRTPANAIAGFAELIEHQMLGDVPAPYRERATAIREQASDLVAAIEDLDTAARLEGRALELPPGIVLLDALLARAVADVAALARERGAALSLTPVPATLAIEADERAAERLVGRLFATLVAAAGADERLTATAMREPGGDALLVVDRPRAFASLTTAQLFALDAEDGGAHGAPLLGAGFAFRLVQGLAAEIGGAFAIEPRRLTLRLPAAVSTSMDRASTR